MDALGLIVLTIPITAPMVIKLGFDPIWFGLIICMMGEIGAITPPWASAFMWSKLWFQRSPWVKYSGVLYRS